MTTIIMTSDVRHTTTIPAAAPTPSTVTTHSPTRSWVYTVIGIMGVVIVVTTVTVIAATAVLLLLRRWSQNQNDPNHDGKGWQIKYYIWILKQVTLYLYRKICFCGSTDSLVSKHYLLSLIYNIQCLSVS